MSQELQAAYGKMAGYLRDEGVVEKDSEQLNDELLDYANVIGLTCTTSDSIKTDAETVDLKRANIDVVIVDEVSKVSFLEGPPFNLFLCHLLMLHTHFLDCWLSSNSLVLPEFLVFPLSSGPDIRRTRTHSVSLPEAGRF